MPPVVQGYSPQSVPRTGGFVVRVIGSGFTGTETVRWSSTSWPGQSFVSTFRVVSDSELVVTTPAVPSQAFAGVILTIGTSTTGTSAIFAFTAAPITLPEDRRCHRRAWLTLGERSLDLEDLAAGYACAELDLGWPAVREVVNNRPDHDGTDDRTRLMGARVVSAHLVAGHFGSRTLDDIARLFGPFIVPSVRPELHWTLNTPADGYAERMLTLRASQFSSPIAGDQKRDIDLAWVASDPIIRDPEWRTSTARPYWGVTGRAYDLTFDRTYPTIGSAAIMAAVSSNGDVTVEPNIRIYGPIDDPYLVVTAYPTGQPTDTRWFRFRAGFRIDAGRYVEIDSAERSVTADDGSHLEAMVQWSGSTWPFCWPNAVLNGVMLYGTNVNWITQAVVTWRDGFLT